MPQPFKISVLISGGGTTLQNLIRWRQSGKLVAEIQQVISNNPDAKGIQFATQAGIDHLIVNHRDFSSIAAFSEAIFAHVRRVQSELVVMGGFLRRLKIPADFENRVINIHPSLIPAFCGKGHYGKKVHQAVLNYGCKFSGCTVHFVDDQYDHGPIIAQRTVPVLPGDDADKLAARVFEQECDLYPTTVNQIATGNVNVHGRIVRVSAPVTPAASPDR